MFIQCFCSYMGGVERVKGISSGTKESQCYESVQCYSCCEPHSGQTPCIILATWSVTCTHSSLQYLVECGHSDVFLQLSQQRDCTQLWTVHQYLSSVSIA